MKNQRKIELNLGKPKSGWVSIEIKLEDFELEFNASNVPINPIDKLCDSLILAIKGIETEIYWNLEPECYFFEFIPCEKNIKLTISERSEITKNRNQVYKIIGDFESLILPIYRSLKKFNALEFNIPDWTEIDQIKLNKLTQLVKERKDFLVKNPCG